MKLAVHLLSCTPEPDRTVAAAARLCYSDASAEDLFSEIGQKKIRGFLEHLRKSGHMSPFEHASFSFGVDGISRICSHQLVRHRMASYSQQSQRYVAMAKPDVIVPPSIEADPVLKERYTALVASSLEAYREFVEKGVPREDARYLLPHGWQTRIVLTMNARELHHFFRLRLCRRAQWEIRELARRMLVLARKEAPVLFTLAGPDCLVEGQCREATPCGNPYSSIEELLADETRF
ncbi:MAG: FAD-dependent thymidylate synthase [Thermovirgaceae bacterium]